MTLLSRWWSGASAAAAPPRAPAPLWPDSHLPLNEPARIAGLLGELAAVGQAVRLHFGGADTAVAARLVRAEGRVLQIAAPAQLFSAGSSPSVAMLSLAMPTALMMFGLRLHQSPRRGDLLSPMPHEVLSVQSRACRRVHCPRGLQPMLQIRLGGWAATGSVHTGLVNLSLVNLSEAGAAVQWSAPAGPDAGWTGSGELIWGGQSLALPRATLLHQRQLSDGSWRGGLRFDALDGASQCTLRRWLNQLETAAVQVRRDA